jgi:sn-glycerol 3-phosphate transport system ATP-binding protein
VATIDLDKVRKVYPGKVEAVKGISFDIADGEFLVLVGPSGCGKSTLLRMIAGLETISSGTVRIDERVVNEIDPADRDIAMVFQNYALYPHMTVYDNLAYGLRNRRTPKDEIERRVQEAARILELSQLLRRRPRELSGGQRQRVAMGRAIVRSPKVFLFDEPLSNLDAKLRGQMRVEIKSLQRSLGVTSVYVTHDQLEAMTLADRLVVMNGGVVEQIGAPLDVYEKPASIFVAGFIGAPPMNLVPLASSGVAYALPDGSTLAIEGHGHGQATTLGFRPEDVVIGGTDALALDFDLALAEPVGAESYLHGTAGGAKVVLRVHGRTHAKPGERLRIGIARERLHVFDKAGKRIEPAHARAASGAQATAAETAPA